MKHFAQCPRCNQKFEIKEPPKDRTKCECGAIMQVYTSYTMTPEERAKYQALPAPDKTEKRPVGVRIAAQELRNREKPKEAKFMAPIKEGPKCGLTREILIEQVAKGETLSSIERAWGMKYNTIHNWVRKWGLKGITAEKAQALLDQTKQPAPMEPEPELLREKNTATRPTTELELLNKAEREIERLTMEVEKLTHERDQLLSNQVSWKEQEETLLQLIEDLKAELPDTKAPVTATLESDPVNPPHYTRGNIECIEAIEAATVGLEGAEAYSTGAVIENLWRWKQKNGVENLQKARLYLERLIGGASR